MISKGLVKRETGERAGKEGEKQRDENESKRINEEYYLAFGPSLYQHR